MNNLVSVIITTYKRPLSILKRAIESVICQTYKEFEIIIVNDNPEDIENTRRIKELLQIYSNTVIYYLEPKCNSGSCAARNLGISKSNGAYLTFLDDDDYWLPNKLMVQIEGFINEQIGVVYTPYFVKFNGNKKLILSLKKDGNVTEDLLYRNTMCIFPMMKSVLVKKIGGFDVNLLSGQEHDLLLRLSLVCDFKYVNEPTAVYDVSDESISMNIDKKIDGFEKFMDKSKKLYSQYPKAYHYQLIRMVNNMNNAGRYKYAFKLWKKALHYNFYSPDNIIQPIKGMAKRILRKKAFH